MKNFDEIAFQAIMETIDGIREDTNLSSQVAKNLIAMDIFVNVMKSCSGFVISSLPPDADEALILDD